MRNAWLAGSQCVEEQRAAQGPYGLLRELNPGPLAPEARIMPLDQAASDFSISHPVANFRYSLAG